MSRTSFFLWPLSLVQRLWLPLSAVSLTLAIPQLTGEGERTAPLLSCLQARLTGTPANRVSSSVQPRWDTMPILPCEAQHFMQTKDWESSSAGHLAEKLSWILVCLSSSKLTDSLWLAFCWLLRHFYCGLLGLEHPFIEMLKNRLRFNMYTPASRIPVISNRQLDFPSLWH